MSEDQETRFPEATLADAARAGEPVLGILSFDRFEKKLNFDKTAEVDQWHWAVRLVRLVDGHAQYVSSSATGALHGWANYSLDRRSDYMMVLEEFRRIFGSADEEGRPLAIGKGLLESRGLVAYWMVEPPHETRMRVKSRKTNPQFMSDKDWPIPFRVAEPAEIELVRALPAYAAPESAGGAATIDKEQAAQYGNGDVERLISIFDGKTAVQAAGAAASSKDLDHAIKADVISGRAHRTLVEKGALTKDEKGVFHAVPA